MRNRRRGSAGRRRSFSRSRPRRMMRRRRPSRVRGLRIGYRF